MPVPGDITMAGDWIKFELSTPDKPEVWAIAASLSIDPDAVVGKLLRVWGWFDQQTEDGNAPSVSKMLLDRLVGVTGFCNSVISAGWMFDDGSTLTLPHFDRHNGKTAKNRALTAKRVAGHKAKTNAEGNEKLTPDALPREEKRREDNKKITGDKSPISLSSWLDKLKTEGQKAIPDDDSIFEYATDAGIPNDWLRLCWIEFRTEFSENGKRQKDWRAHFRNFVRKNYYKLWWLDGGNYQLTSRGQQAMTAMIARAKRDEQ
jgi:hypothetical protein